VTALLATTAAAVFGCADFLGGVASRKASALSVSAVSQAVSLLLLIPALLLFPAESVTARDIGLGALGGLFGGLGVAALYAGLAAGRMGVVTPITAALAASIPAAVDFAMGTSPRVLGVVGLVLAVVAIIIVSTSRHGAEKTSMRALGLSVLAGTMFAGFFIVISFTDPASGLWPLLGARLASVPFLTVLALVRGAGLRIPREALPATLGAGVLDMAANVALLAAVRSGPLAVASVLASLYPVATVLLARFVLGEHMSRTQRVGIALAMLAVILASLG
jgi:drug/metabolite transporter (DMT)-like permease